MLLCSTIGKNAYAWSEVIHYYLENQNNKNYLTHRQYFKSFARLHLFSFFSLSILLYNFFSVVRSGQNYEIVESREEKILVVTGDEVLMTEEVTSDVAKQLPQAQVKDGQSKGIITNFKLYIESSDDSK